MFYKTNEEAQDACKEWQKILRLQDWAVKVFIKRARDMSLEGGQGEVHWGLQSKSASILLLDPLDYPPGLRQEQDMEKTLVHELLHLHSAPFDNFEYESLENTALEQAIDLTAEALVELKRGAKE